MVPIGIEELSRLPIELDRDVGATVHISTHLALVPDSERGHRLRASAHLEAQPLPALAKRFGRADHAFARSHRVSSSIDSTSASGARACSASRGCAPYATATAGTP